MQVLRDLDTSDLFLKIRALVFDITKKLLVRLLNFLIHLKDIFSTKRGAPLGAGPHSWEWVEWGQNRPCFKVKLKLFKASYNINANMIHRNL